MSRRRPQWDDPAGALPGIRGPSRLDDPTFGDPFAGASNSNPFGIILNADLCSHAAPRYGAETLPQNFNYTQQEIEGAQGRLEQYGIWHTWTRNLGSIAGDHRFEDPYQYLGGFDDHYTMDSNDLYGGIGAQFQPGHIWQQSWPNGPHVPWPR